MNVTSSYDSVFFKSKLHRGRHIESLHTQCLLKGITTPLPASARVLEIGCATGHALFPMATEYPQGEYVGIDPSQAQIEHAQKIRAALQCNNVEFRCGEVTQTLKTSEKFDYILCHGVFSWVSEGQRHQILQTIGAHLSSEGVALISFNTAPGSAVRQCLWNSVKNLIGPAQSVRDARELLEDYRNIIEFDYERPYQVLLYQELSRILSESDSYLLHEVLAKENTSFSYQEFSQLAAEHQLEIVGDVRPHRNGMNRLMSSHVADEAYASLSRLQKRGLAVEQLLDGTVGTPFREMIITAAGRAVQEEGDLTKYHTLSFALASCQLLEPEGEDDKSLTIHAASGRIEKITHPLLKDILQLLMAVRPNFLPFVHLQQKFPSEEPLLIARALSECINREIVLVSNYPSIVAPAVYAHPKTTDYIRYQSRQEDGASFTNLLYETIEVDSLAAKFLQHLDGETDKQALQKLVKVWLASGEGSIKADGVVVEDSVEIEENLPMLVESTLETLRKGGMLLP